MTQVVLPPGFEKAFFQKRDLEVLDALTRSTIGIAGAGGLGSNAAAALTRAGIGRLIVADFDVLEPSDLNRQYYFRDQVGSLKVEALRDNLVRMNPFSRCEIHPVRVDRSNVAALFGEADIMIEAFDLAEEKQILIEAWLSAFPDRPIIAASGLAGHGRNRLLKQRRLGNLFLCGDEAGDCTECDAPMAPRVAIVAGMQANLAIELLVRKRRRSCSK